MSDVQQQRQQATGELRQWILAQAQAGCSVETVFQAMKASGWQEDIAASALEETLLVKLAGGASQHGLPPPTRVPEPNLHESPAQLWAGDRDVSVIMAMRNPRVVVFGELLTSDECDELQVLAQPRLTRSTTLSNTSGDSEVDVARTSQGMFFDRGENPLCVRIERRISALLNWPVDNGEGLQVLRYAPGAEYRPHYDYFDPRLPGRAPSLERGGQRVGTLLMYLSTPSKGGGTLFPDVQLEVSPLKGHAVFFSYDRPHQMTRTLHGGSPVIDGEKWAATKWLRERAFA
ncbi:MAG: 2OG-Fe(II) oxygenase [Rhizobacter sp.]